MNGSTQREDFTRMSRQGFDLIFQGVDMYNRMMRYWMDFADLSGRGKGEETAKNMVDYFSSSVRDSINRCFAPVRSFTNPAEFLQLWQDYFSLYFAALPQIGMDKLADFSKMQQEQLNKLANSWIDYARRMGDLGRKSLEKKENGRIMKESLSASESLLNSWLSFVTEETRNSFQLFKSSVEEQIEKQTGQTQQQ